MGALDVIRKSLGDGLSARRAWGGAYCVMAGTLMTLRSPSLLALAIVPVMINTALYVVFGFGAWSILTPAYAWLLPWERPDAWYAILWVIASTLVWLMLAAVIFLTALMLATALGSMLAAPLLDSISFKAEALLTGKEPPPGPGALEAAWRAVKGQLWLLMIYALVMIAVGIVYVIPGVGAVAGPPIQAFITVSFLVLQFVEWPAERRRLALTARLRLVGDHKAASVGFGAACWFMMLCPFTLPFLAVGGTMFFLGLPTGPAVEAP